MSEMIGNRYLLVKKIGNGGMADVFLAMDTVLNREVALKRLRGDLSHDPVALLRFQREANAASGLDHSGIVDVYDVGEDNGQHYIVMEVIRGTTLKELIHRRGALDKVEATAIMRQLCYALQVAHEKKVIHRDIKPQNILVKDDGTVKITDFGIALAGDALQLTRSDSVLGSVHYMAPELSRGEGASVQSDIYALGVVFYELLAGDVPYRGETPVEIAMKHMRDPFPSIKKFNTTLPNSIANIIAKATHKNRNYRYGNIEEMIDDLQDCLDPSRAEEPIWEADAADDEGTKLIDKLDTIVQPKIDPVKARRKKIMIYSGIGLSVVLLIGLIWMFTRPKPLSEIKIPKVEGMTAEKATETLEGLGLNVNPNYTYQYSDDHELGIVISSRPGVDGIARPGDMVKLTVSQGKMFEVPDLTGKTVEEARALLVNTKIELKQREEATNAMEPGIIIRQEGLTAGEKIIPNQKRELIIYVSGKVQLQIPSDIVGMGIDEAKGKLEGMGLTVRTEEISQDGMSETTIAALQYGVVIRTDPLPGSFFVQRDDNYVTLFYYIEKEKPATPDKPVTPEKPTEPEKPANSEKPKD
ncbi:Stk1 family PASTA domain-containing Ser/Thr kinase [Erysipelothrix sp. HDW6C]|uniref:Stk1 family PASTA domain-containing Ser/Thr kinase n=1 Tax=Erysipelothrix sp. HDW6C TaxID=2714930 RepID=UPI00140E1726|nr:Stk1 family PASTA domain-containing Ser/Thr kinase [Erysipelothrix sp. HDW6C]QIK70228.1 Stk1 family PASTA domain-containing Ser/Thr kinase [Erysipelothrix sp. HDW6C]